MQDLLFCRELPACRPPNVFHDLFRRFLYRPGFLSDLRSLKAYDEPEILPSSTRPICLIGADAGQSALDRTPEESANCRPGGLAPGAGISVPEKRPFSSRSRRRCYSSRYFFLGGVAIFMSEGRTPRPSASPFSASWLHGYYELDLSPSQFSIKEARWLRA